MVMNGVDVSHWQGSIDWAKVRKSGVECAILKAGGSDAGFYKDSKFEANYAGATAAGLHVGAYYFVGRGCTSGADGKADAQRFMKQVAGKTFDLPLYLDFEAPGKQTRTGNTDATVAFCNALEQGGYYAGIYASDVSGFQDRLELARLQGRYALWVARYGSQPKVVSGYGAWQHSDSGSVSGIAGSKVDLDFIYQDYPSIIRKAGLNGYGKGSASSGEEATTKTRGKHITRALVNQVIRGEWGNGAERKKKLEAEGYDAAKVQQRVNAALKK